MRCTLWPHHSITEHQAEMTAWVRPDVAVFVCSRESGGLCVPGGLVRHPLEGRRRLAWHPT
jgi:hypothetical protein